MDKSIFSFLNLATVLLGFVVIVSFVFIKWFFSGCKINPFENDCARSPCPINTNKEHYRRLIKQVFAPELVPKNLDAIIIGSGIGGLSAAAILSKAGKKVLVLEQLKKAGGCTHTFREKGVEFDIGIHYIGDMMTRSVARTFIDQITEGQLQWAAMDDAFDVVVIGEPPNERRYEVCSGPKKIENLKKYFPEDTEAIDKFFAMVKDAGKNFLPYLIFTRLFPRVIVKLLNKFGFYNHFGWDLFHQITLEQYLQNLTSNKELRAVLAYCFGDYGSLPKEASVGFHSLLWKHFFHGAAYPVGGASEVAKTIIPIIEKSGGKVLVGAQVTQIICKNGKAVGVVVDNKKQRPMKIHASIIISDAGVRNTFNKLLTPEASKNTTIMDTISKIQHGKGGFSIFVGLEGTKEELELKSQNIWSFPDNDVDDLTRKYLSTPDSEVMDMPSPLMFLSFPSAKDPTWEERHPGKSSLAIVTLVSYEWFEKWKSSPVKRRGDDYNSFKTALADNLVEKCVKLYPHLKHKINDVCVGSPLSNDHYIASPRGEIYGMDHTIDRFSPEVFSALRPATEIPGLYITGQDAMSCGFSGAIQGGIMCASSILGRIVMKDLINLHNKIQKKSKTT